MIDEEELSYASFYKKQNKKKKKKEKKNMKQPDSIKPSLLFSFFDVLLASRGSSVRLYLSL